MLEKKSSLPKQKFMYTSMHLSVKKIYSVSMKGVCSLKKLPFKAKTHSIPFIQIT